MDRLSRCISTPNCWFAGYAIWFAALFALSSISSGPGGPRIPHLDKVAHATYFTAGSAVLGMGLLLRSPRIARRRIFWILVVAALLVGAFDEWHQTHTAGRSGNDIGDLTADVLGGCLGFFAASFMFRFANRRGLLRKVGA